MNKLQTFNAWMLNKIISYLSTKEGCKLEETHYTEVGVKSIVRDAFGQRYELHIKSLSRLNNNAEDFDDNYYIEKTDVFTVSKTYESYEWE